MGGRHCGIVRRVVALVAIATVASGCIGATDRSDFEAEVRARGGGVSTAWITEAVGLAASEVGAADPSELSVMRISINSTNRSVTVMARRADRPEFVDNVSIREGEVLSSTPLQDADQLPLDEITFPISDVPLDELENIADEALAAFDAPDGFVDRITVRLVDDAPTIEVDVESSRRTGTVVFDTDGNLLEVER